MNYVKVEEWMLELGLKPGELLAFAVIYSFGSTGEWFQGTASFLGKWMATKRKHTVLDVLSSLVQKGLLEKRERWVKGEKLCDYRPVRKAHRGGAENAPGGGAENGLHIYSSDRNKDKKKIYKRKVNQSVDDFLKRHADR